MINIISFQYIYIQKKYIFYSFILFFLKINYIDCIFLPIETLTEDNYLIKNDSIHQSVMRKSLMRSIYTLFEVGTPIQKVPLFIKTNGLEYEITSLTINKENMIQYHFTYNLSSIFNLYDFFNENKSSTFKTEGCKNNYNIFSDHQEDCMSNDIIQFYQDKNFEKKIKYESIDFNLVKNKEENITGTIGLGLFDKSGDIDKSFLKILKRKKVINNYNWYFIFDSWSDSNGKLIIGSLPHEDYPDIYSEEDLVYTYVPFDYSSITKTYKIEFDDVYTTSLNSTFSIKLFSKNAKLVFDSNIIIGPKELETKLKDKFLQNFITDKKCFTENFRLSIDYYNQLTFYYCDINIKNILYEVLSSIKFLSKDFNFTFELTKEELYIIENNYIYFKILFDSGRQNEWFLGRPISLKYPFVFNPDNNKIGLYRNKKNIININSNIEKKNFNLNKGILIFIVFILSIGLVILGIHIGKIIYGIRRKQRANELSDNYDYISTENNKNLKFDINDKDINYENSNPSIEMKIKI